MALNLSQMRTLVKSTTLSRAALNLATGSGQAAAYRALKDLGWTCGDGGVNLEKHPTDRVPVFRLNGAALRRDRRDRTGWILEVGQDTYAVRTTALDDLTELTERATAMAAPVSDAERVIADLLGQHPQLEGWAQRGLALVERGDFDPTRYDTRIVIETGHYECDCPARAPRVNTGNVLMIETFFNGKGCKHAIALHILTVLDHEAEAVAYREHFEKRERRRGSVPADAPLTLDERFELDDLRRSDYRSGHTYSTVPGDGGVSDQDLAAPLPAESYRQICQGQLNDPVALAQTLATMRSHLPRLSNGAARQMQAAIDWAEEWGKFDTPVSAAAQALARSSAKVKANAGAYEAALKPDRLNTRGRQRDFQHRGHRYG